MPHSEMLVGVAGWSYGDWEDVVYPRSERDKLAYMARYLDCIEINTSFYRPVAPRMAEKWLRSIAQNPRFRFTAKLWQRFTHQTEEEYAPKDVEVFTEGLRPLTDAGKLMALLVQFPFFFRDSLLSRDLLSRIAGDFADYPRVLEVRDVSWSEPEALEFIRDLDMNIACLDMPLSKSAFRETALVTGPLGYLRMHGRNREAWFSKDAGRDEKYNYLYSGAELDQIIGRVEKMREVARLVVVIWNNHFRGQAAVNAFQALSRLLGRRVSVPELLRKSYPELRAISQEEGGSLFER